MTEEKLAMLREQIENLREDRSEARAFMRLLRKERDAAMDRGAELRARLAMHEPFQETHLHLKSNGIYQMHGTVINSTNGDHNGEVMVLYRDQANSWFVREK